MYWLVVMMMSCYSLRQCCMTDATSCTLSSETALCLETRRQQWFILLAYRILPCQWVSPDNRLFCSNSMITICKYSLPFQWTLAQHCWGSSKDRTAFCPVCRLKSYVVPILFGVNGVRNKRSHLVGPPFPVFKVCFSATAGLHFSRDFTMCLLIGGCGQSHIC